MWCTSAQPASARRPETRWRFHLSRCPGFGVHLWLRYSVSLMFVGVPRNYDQLDENLRAELPLKRIWTVAAQDDD